VRCVVAIQNPRNRQAKLVAEITEVTSGRFVTPNAVTETQRHRHVALATVQYLSSTASSDHPHQGLIRSLNLTDRAHSPSTTRTTSPTPSTHEYLDLSQPPPCLKKSSTSKSSSRSAGARMLPVRLYPPSPKSPNPNDKGFL